MNIKTYIGEAYAKEPGSNLYTLKNIVEAHSLVRQFIDLLARQVSQVAKIAVDISGVDRSYTPYATTFGLNAMSGITILGLVVGTGTDAVTMSDYKLQSQLTTNLAHAQVAFSGPTLSGSTVYIDIIRTFTNNTGAGITIREVGLYANGYGVAYNHMIDRTLYELAIGNTEAKTLAYRIAITA